MPNCIDARSRAQQHPDFSNEPHIGPSTLEHKRADIEARKDQELLDAIRIGKQTLGANHPLVIAAVDSLRVKERRRAVVKGVGDELSQEIVSKGDARHQREQAVAAAVSAILNERPIMEARLAGFGRRRVDMYYPKHALVVEENGPGHYAPAGRDELLEKVCEEQGLKLLVIKGHEPLTDKYLRRRLGHLGLLR